MQFLPELHLAFPNLHTYKQNQNSTETSRRPLIAGYKRESHMNPRNSQVKTSPRAARIRTCFIDFLAPRCISYLLTFFAENAFNVLSINYVQLIKQFTS